jgi:ATPase subunit of ABC transporter with duplicated ATPase domains
MLVNHFEQNQAEALDLDETALSTVERAAAEALEQRSIEEKDRDRDGGSQADADVNAKALLGRMGFKGEAMERQVSALSGGEKARLALAQFVATPANVLLLDEPTNHMDIPSREALEEAVQNFDGTVIAASHDRYFLKQIATRVVYVGENAARGLEEDLAEGEALQAEAQRIRGADDGADNGEQAPGSNGKGSKKKGKKQKQKGGKR